MRPDYYKVLGVQPDASTEEIRIAWRTLARTHHPDRHAGTEHPNGYSMILLNEAWETLGNSSRRASYDLSRSVREPRPVQDAVLAAARAELVGCGWAATAVSDRDVLLVRSGLRVAVRFARCLDRVALEAWLPNAGVRFGSGAINCAVVVACRVLAKEEAALRIEAVSFPAAAIDLTDARVFGGFPSGVEALFRPFLPAG